MQTTQCANNSANPKAASQVMCHPRYRIAYWCTDTNRIRHVSKHVQCMSAFTLILYGLGRFGVFIATPDSGHSLTLTPNGDDKRPVPPRGAFTTITQTHTHIHTTGAFLCRAHFQAGMLAKRQFIATWRDLALAKYIYKAGAPDSRSVRRARPPKSTLMADIETAESKCVCVSSLSRWRVRLKWCNARSRAHNDVGWGFLGTNRMDVSENVCFWEEKEKRWHRHRRLNAKNKNVMAD